MTGSFFVHANFPARYIPPEKQARYKTVTKSEFAHTNVPVMCKDAVIKTAHAASLSEALCSTVIGSFFANTNFLASYTHPAGKALDSTVHRFLICSRQNSCHEYTPRPRQALWSTVTGSFFVFANFPASYTPPEKQALYKTVTISNFFHANFPVMFKDAVINTRPKILLHPSRCLSAMPLPFGPRRRYIIEMYI